MLSFAPDGLITADPGNIKKTDCMCRAKLAQHCANDRMRGRFRVVRNETDVHWIATRPGAHLRCVLRIARPRSLKSVLSRITESAVAHAHHSRGRSTVT